MVIQLVLLTQVEYIHGDLIKEVSLVWEIGNLNITLKWLLRIY
jgi:hypothetical protein